MAFESPGAWLGLSLLLLPVAIHMLVRDRAPRVRLPTLRFLTGAPPVAVRWSRAADRLLLLVRLAILALAIAALARPVIEGDSERANSPGVGVAPARVILLDESASMLRTTAGGGGESALARARGLAEDYADGASLTRVVPFGGQRALATALEGASEWIRSRGGGGDIVVLSDFQRGVLEGVDTTGIEPWVAVRVEVDPASAPPWEVATLDGTLVVSARLDAEAGADAGGFVEAEWVAEGPATDASALGFEPGVAETAPVAALHGALRQTRALAPEATFPLVVRFAAEGASGADGARAVLGPREPATGASPAGAEAFGSGAGRLLLDLASDPLLVRAAAVAESEPGVPGPLVVARNAAGVPVVTAAAHGGGGLLLEVASPPRSVLSAAVLTAVGRALYGGPGGAELDPRGADSGAVEVSTGPSGEPAAEMDAEPTEPGDPAAPLPRALWLIVLMLLGAEHLYRRRIHDDRH